MRITAEPRSDQWNADDFIGHERTFTIAGVRAGAAEQKYDIELIEGEGRVWRPPLTMLRLLIAAWGDEAEQWKGRRVTLYRDESVRFGPESVGGIRIAAMSDLPNGKPFTTKLTTARGKRGTFTVNPLPDSPAPSSSPEPTLAEINATTDVADLRAMWGRATTDKTKALITARKDELTATAETARAAVQDALAGTEAE